MSTLLGSTLPDLLLARLGPGRDRVPQDIAVTAVSVDADGYAHPSLLSYGEIASDGSGHLRVAVFGRSTTAGNLRRNGRLTLAFVDVAGAFYVKGEITGAETALATAPGVVVFPMSVVQVLADRVDPTREPDASILSGIRFHRHRTGTVL